MIYFLVLFCRVLLITIPLTYLRWAMIIFPVLMVSFNVAVLQCCHSLGIDKKKNILTAIIASCIPIGFVAKRDIHHMESPGLRLAKFYLINNIFFSIVSLLALLSTNLVLHYDVITNFYIDACAGMPFTSCHQIWSDALSGGRYSNHVTFFFYGNAFYIAILLLHFCLSFYFLPHCYNRIYHIT